MKLNDENFELYLLRYCEGTLPDQERADVERSLADHPEWRELVELYNASPRLSSAEPAPYAHRERLVDGGTRRRKMLWLWPSVAAAACVALVVGTLLFHTPTAGMSVAKVADVAIPIQPEMVPEEEAAMQPASAATIVDQPTRQHQSPNTYRRHEATAVVAANNPLPAVDAIEELIPISAPEVAVLAQKEPSLPEPVKQVQEDAILLQQEVQQPVSLFSDQLITYVDEAPDSVDQLSHPYDMWASRARSVMSIVRMGSHVVSRSRERYYERLDQFYSEENLDAEHRMITRNLIASIF